MGSASTYDGSELAAREKVVVVVLQHRLGILGFLRWAGPETHAWDQGRGLLGSWAKGGGGEDWVEERGVVYGGRVLVRGVAGVMLGADR